MLAKPHGCWGVTVFRVDPERAATLSWMSHEAPPGYASSRPELLSRAETERILCVSRKTLWRLVASGVLPVVYLDRRPRFLSDDVWAYVLSRRVRREERR